MCASITAQSEPPRTRANGQPTPCRRPRPARTRPSLSVQQGLILLWSDAVEGLDATGPVGEALGLPKRRIHLPPTLHPGPHVGPAGGPFVALSRSSNHALPPTPIIPHKPLDNPPEVCDTLLVQPPPLPLPRDDGWKRGHPVPASLARLRHPAIPTGLTANMMKVPRSAHPLPSSWRLRDSSLS